MSLAEHGAIDGLESADAGATARRGRTTFTVRALQQLTAGLAKDAAQAGLRDIAVKLADDAGDLRVSVVVPVLITTPPRSIDDQSGRLRAGIISGLGELAGRRVSAVDVRFTGVRHAVERRVI